jgi:acetyl-CoA acetyltransferase family protein
MKSSRARDVVIVEAVRTPIGRGHPDKGYYARTHANELLGAALVELLRRAGIDPLNVDDVIGGCVHQYGEQMYNVTRNSWLQAGLPFEVPATTVERQCGSAQQALNFATAMISSGAQDVVIACGVEHMGHVPMGAGWNWVDEVGTPWPDAMMARYEIIPQGLSAELIAERWELAREELDELSAESHHRAHRATVEGRFAREIVPFEVGSETLTVDQGIRPETTVEVLGSLKPAFKPDGVLTAGNSSQISDGAAAVLLMAAETARELGLRPRARIVDHVSVGVDPVIMLTGPIPATRAILERNDLTLDDVDLVEINEAFASVVLAWRREFAPDMSRVNVNGGAIALGHPLGSSGARLATTLLHELERTDGELGLITMCCGGGQGVATLIERVDT